MSIQKYDHKIYAGVLGKILGVYLGRPVEGWSYEKIRETFGQIHYYVHDKVGVPLIVADDDISGTFAFFRAIADHGFQAHTTAKEFGDTWLNDLRQFYRGELKEGLLSISVYGGSYEVCGSISRGDG